MKSLISINKKFMVVTPNRLVELMLDSKSCKGVEACVDYDSQEELKYLYDLTFLLKRENLILQIHGDSSVDLDKQIEFLKKMEKYSDDLDYPIVVTLHSIYDEDKNESLRKSVEYFDYVVKNIDTSKVVVCMENLNSEAFGNDRLAKEEITEAVLNNDSVFFTYDIGHELVDYGDFTNLNKYLAEEIRNIHLHTHDIQGNAHLPIYKNDPYLNDVMKALVFLINNRYDAGIVYEYDLYACRGEEIEDKIKDYLESMDFVSEKYM